MNWLSFSIGFLLGTLIFGLIAANNAVKVRSLRDYVGSQIADEAQGLWAKMLAWFKSKWRKV
jgi:hypothetical protein